MLSTKSSDTNQNVAFTFNSYKGCHPVVYQHVILLSTFGSTCFWWKIVIWSL